MREPTTTEIFWQQEIYGRIKDLIPDLLQYIICKVQFQQKITKHAKKVEKYKRKIFWYDLVVGISRQKYRIRYYKYIQKLNQANCI